MSPETPQKERSSVHMRLAPAFLRSALAAIILASANPVSAVPNKDSAKVSDNLKNDSESNEFYTECVLTGYLKISGGEIRMMNAETLCHKDSKRLFLKNTVLTPDKSGHYKIPGTDAYFYIGVNGEPIVSFIKNGKRTNGMLRKAEKEGFSFEVYMDWIYPKNR